MDKVYHLASCSTCKKIIDDLGIRETFELQNIKEENIDAIDLDAIAHQTGSYEAIFSKRAMKYKSMGLKDKKLSEQDFKNLILEEYTFLKRPVIKINNQYFVGNSKKVITAAAEALANR